MAADLVADYQRLKELADDLRRIRNRFSAVDDRCDFSPEVFGGELILNATRQFADGWRDGRAKLTEGMEQLATELAEVAARYKELDERLKCESEPAPAPGVNGPHAARGTSSTSTGAAAPMPGISPMGASPNRPAPPYRMTGPGTDAGGWGGAATEDCRQTIQGELDSLRTRLSGAEATTADLQRRQDELERELERVQRIDELCAGHLERHCPDAAGADPVVHVDPSEHGSITIALTPGASGAPTVIVVGQPAQGWDRILAGPDAGDALANNIAAGVVGEDGGTGHGARVMSHQQPSQGSGAQLADAISVAGNGEPVSLVAEPSALPMVKEALREGAAIDSVAVMGGSPLAAADLEARGVEATSLPVDNAGWCQALLEWLGFEGKIS